MGDRTPSYPRRRRSREAECVFAVWVVPVRRVEPFRFAAEPVWRCALAPPRAALVVPAPPRGALVLPAPLPADRVPQVPPPWRARVRVAQRVRLEPVPFVRLPRHGFVPPGRRPFALFLPLVQISSCEWRSQSARCWKALIAEMGLVRPSL